MAAQNIEGGRKNHINIKIRGGEIVEEFSVGGVSGETNMRATDSQVRLFFAIVHKIGGDAVEYKERAKKTYNLESFNDISSDQISFLIAKMKAYAEKHGIELNLQEEKERKKEEEWDETPNKLKNTRQLDKKDWRQVVSKIAEACNHDWVELQSEFNKFHASRCLKCPTIKLEIYQKEACEMVINYRPIEKRVDNDIVGVFRDYEDIRDGEK